MSYNNNNNNRSHLLFGPMSVYIIRDMKRRILYDIYETERRNLKGDRANLKIPLTKRLIIQQQLINLPGSPNKIKNRCILTGRSRSISRFFKFSRIMIRELAAYGLLPGVRKSSW